ncbi:MAG: endo-1,4-beta-xylanase [Bacillota bacterium]|nr:endo-1,4-beta-xylanase [Bacillota bacterium]
MIRKITSCLLLLIMILSIGFSGCSDKQDTKKDTSKNSSQTVQQSKTLRQLADQYGVLIGAAVEPKYLSETDYANTLKSEYSVITPENVMKWGTIHPKQDKYDFTGADQLVDFAQKNNMKIRGHNLAWYNIDNPAWLENGTWTKEQLLNILKDHIMTVVGHFKGKVYAWDVCNEVIGDTVPYDYRDNIWYRVIGPEYIEKAFEWAHEADPAAKLYLNDYNMEEKNLKSDYLYNLVKSLKDKGIPIDGVGFQFHVNIDALPDMASVYDNVKRFIDLGVAVDFTEIDVRLNSEPTQTLLNKEAQVYSDLMEIALSLGVKNYTMWGITDAHSWIPDQYKGSGWGLIFDDKYKPKPAYTSIHSDLEKGPSGINFLQKLKDQEAARNIIPAFKCNSVSTVPTLDGIESPGEWKDAVTYEFAYDQLNDDTRPPLNLKDFDGDWRVLYNKNTLYGIVNRVDNVTQNEISPSYQNDCMELFIDVNGKFTQLRAVVGKDWEESPMPGAKKIKWSKDGKTCEFSVELPESDVAGLTVGWNIALSDNDGGPERSRQVYPFPGSNQSYQGKDLGALKFVGSTDKPVDKNRIVPPFVARKYFIKPTVDGEINDFEYFMPHRYIFAYNQLNPTDQRRPKDLKDIYGDWTLTFDKNILYGAIDRQDDVTVTNSSDVHNNDNIELTFKIDGKVYNLTDVVGKDFEPNNSGLEAKAVWNSTGTAMEFSIVLPVDDLSDKTIGFNIALTDNDGGDKVKYRLFPIPGEYTGDNSKSMCDLYLSPS